MEVEREVGRADVDVQSLSALVEQDPALCAQLLKLANSAYFGFSRQVDTARDAIMVVGLQNVADLVSCIATVPWFTVSVGGLDSAALWLHSCYVGEAARIVARELGHEDGSVYLGGLLHDVGMIVLAECAPRSYQKALDYGREAQVPLVDAEREILGVDHGWAAHVLFEAWGFPETLIDIAEEHHGATEEASRSSLVVEVANTLAVREGTSEDTSGRDLAPQISERARTELALDDERLDELALALHERRDATELLQRETLAFGAQQA